MLFLLLQKRERSWFVMDRSLRSNGRERIGGQKNCGLGLSPAVSLNLVNTHTQCFRFPPQRMGNTNFRSRGILNISKQKEKNRELYDSDIQTNVIQKEDPYTLMRV